MKVRFDGVPTEGRRLGFSEHWFRNSFIVFLKAGGCPEELAEALSRGIIGKLEQ